MAIHEVYEAARAIPVLDEADVVVAGGGVAGCAAAWAAAAAGARTIILERNGCLGGVATASLMANIGNLYLTASDRQVVHGFAGLLAQRMVAAGAASADWRSREIPGCVIDSERLKVVLIEMLQERGVTVLTHCLGARPIMHEDRVTGVFIENKSGRQATLARATVDCTGEGDIAWQAGAQVAFEGGSASTLFKLANVDLDAFVAFLGQDPAGFPDHQDMTRDIETFDRNWRERGILFFPHGGGRKWRFLKRFLDSGEYPAQSQPAWGLSALGMYALRRTGFVVINSNFYNIRDLDVRHLSEFELHSQKMCYLVADLLRRIVPGFERAYVAHVGVDLGVRTSRLVHARHAFDGKDLGVAGKTTRFEDVIAVHPVHDSAWSGGQPFSDATCDVPFGVTVPIGCRGLLNASGKSVHTRPKGVLRSMVGCMGLGQAAGVASALAAKRGTDAADVPIRDIQRELLRQGAWLGDADRLRELGLA